MTGVESITLKHAGEEYLMVNLRDNFRVACLCADQLSDTLREADREEIRARSGMNPGDALNMAVMVPQATQWAIVRDEGEVVGMCGVGPTGVETMGEVWFLGTNLISHRPVAFTKLALGMIDDPRFTGGYPILHNYVDERNTAHVRWLASLGFQFIARHSRFGMAGLPFLEFIRARPDVRPGNDVRRKLRRSAGLSGRTDDGDATAVQCL